MLFYHPLAQALGDAQPFYALQAPGLDGRPIQRTSIEAMAAYYLEQIRPVQPAGPYLLGGYSFGGAVAYEMACRLQAGGETVALLALFDATPPAGARRPLRARLRRALRDPAALVSPNRLFDFLVRHSHGDANAAVLRWHETLHRRLKWKALGHAGEPIDPTVLHVRLVNEVAALNYRPRPYAGKVTLFRTLEAPGPAPLEPDPRWRRMAGGGLEIHDFPGSHLELFSAPNSPRLAHTLARCIHAALEQDAATSQCQASSELSHSPSAF